jgi:tetratricopeptide (TPR) repeat protein
MWRRTVVVSVVLVGHAVLARAQPAIVSDFPFHESTVVFSLDRDGGGALVNALRTQPARASALQILLKHGYVDDSLTVLSRIVAEDGPELLPGFQSAIHTTVWWTDQRRREEIRSTLAGIAERAKAAAERRPRDEAADIARQILQLEMNWTGGSRDERVAHLRRFAETYEGTPAALSAEVELIAESLPIARQVDAAEQFAREHPGTVAGARALHHAAFQLAHNYPIAGLEAPGSDPTDRLVRVAAIARELERGPYPPSEWVTRAPTLVTDFFVPDSVPASYAPGNLQRSLAEYEQFVRTHLTWQDPYPPNDSIGFMVSHSVWNLWSLQGDPTAGAERFFDGLAADPTLREAARFLQARTYLARIQERRGDASWSRARAVALLTDLARNGTERVRRQAHAMLASELFAGGEDRAACTEFRRFVTAYPKSDWAWVAGLRIGQCEEALHRWQAAAEAYRRTATIHADKPAAILLGRAYGARALEGTGDFKAALGEYQQAAAAWFGKDSSRYSLSIWRRTPSETPPFGRDAYEVRKPDLELRREQLRTTLALPGGSLLERARWALERSRNDTRTLAGQLIAQFPRSPLVSDARRLIRVADYEDALDLAAADRPRDVPGAQARLERLSRESGDVISSLAKIARASLMATGGLSGSDALMKQALEEWRALQVPAAPAAPGSLEADANEVRREAFLPLGGGVYRSGWASEWPAALPPFLIASATLPVLEFNGRLSIVSVARPLPGFENTLYLSQDDFDLLEKTVAILGGSLGESLTVAGASESIRTLWNRFFPLRLGHAGGWRLATNPVIGRIEFTNPERTRASVPITIGNSGGTVLLERDGGQWRAIEITNWWIA